jgi:hypothetical protein
MATELNVYRKWGKDDWRYYGTFTDLQEAVDWMEAKGYPRSEWRVQPPAGLQGNSATTDVTAAYPDSH